jgi:ABC-2 type transport system permease protein
MNLALLYVDELRGFYRSKVMLFLWVGLPVIAVLFHFVQASSTNQDMPFSVVSALVVSSIAGTLAAVMLTVSIINEKNRHVYELFLVRPLKRRDLLLGKGLAIYTCVAVASLVAVFIGLAVDYFAGSTLPATLFSNLAQSLAVSLSMLAVACSVGVLIGVASPSILVGAILVIYGGNQISVIPLVPTLLNLSHVVLLTVGLAALVAVTFLVVAIALFNRKQF